jgi:tyrosine-protein kinase
MGSCHAKREERNIHLGTPFVTLSQRRQKPNPYGKEDILEREKRRVLCSFIFMLINLLVENPWIRFEHVWIQDKSLLKDGSPMKNPLNYYTMLAKRWAWMMILGAVLCGSASFVISKITPPVYQASSILILNVGTSASSNENFTVSVQAVPTYVQLLNSSAVLSPVVEKHPGLKLEQLQAMITAKPQNNTPIIELDVVNRSPQLALELSSEVSQSLAQFSNSQLPGTIQILPALLNPGPVSPKVLQNTVIGALVGLGLALALMFFFEWRDDRLKSSEEVQELLGMETLTVIPRLSRRQRTKEVEEIPTLAEGYRILSAKLVVAQKVKSFKLVMVTSALEGEGKSSVATNLASFLAMAGNQVLLVDADLRGPVLDQHFELENWPELANSFEEWAEVEVYMEGQVTNIPNLQVLTAGALPSSFINLLQSQQGNQLLERFRKAPFDYVIFDTPPLLPVADAQLLASYVQAIVLVVDPTKTPRKLLLRVKQLLAKMHTQVLGVVINKSRWPEDGEIRQYLKDARRPPRAIPAMTGPSETPSVNGLGDPSDITVVLPSLQATKEYQE